jgi:hypothetical protein
VATWDVPSLLVLTAGNSAAFIPLVFLHAISALVGFGSVGFAGTYAGRLVHLAGSGELIGRKPAEGALAGVRTANPRSSASAAPQAGRQQEEVAEPGQLGPKMEQPSGGDAGPLAEQVEEGQLDPEVEELVRYFERPARFWKAVLAVPVLGVLALEFQPSGRGLDQIWTVAALFVWFVATVLIVGVVVPSLKQVNLMLPQVVGAVTERSGDAQGGEPTPGTGTGLARQALQVRVRRAGSLASRGAAVCDVLFFAGLALMIWRP